MFRRLKNGKHIQRLKFDGGEWQYVHPGPDQRVCAHPAAFNQVYEFNSYRQHLIRLDANEFKRYYAVDADHRLVFNGRPLLSEHEFIQQFAGVPPNEDADHLASCAQCREFHKVERTIRKRDKLRQKDEIPDLAFRLGKGERLDKLAGDFGLSVQSVRAYKRKLLRDELVSAPKLKQFTSLSSTQQSLIRKLVCSDGFVNLKYIKNRLKLDCHYLTIRNFLRHSGVFRCLATHLPLVSPVNMKLKEQFARTVCDLSAADYKVIVFSDEKTFQSYHNGRVYVYRKRGTGSHPRYRYRRNKSSNFKLNCFGFLTSQGVGNLYIFENKTDTKCFVNYFNNTILPDIISKVGSQFVLMVDGASFHVSKFSLELYLRTGTQVLCWPPQSPEWNPVEDLWGIVSRRVNRRIFKEGPPTDEEHLARYVYQAWHSIDASIVNNLYESLPKRISRFLSERLESKSPSPPK